MSITESTSISSGPGDTNEVNQLLRIVEQVGEGVERGGATFEFKVQLKKESDPHYEIKTVIKFNIPDNGDDNYLKSTTVVRDTRQMTAFLKQLSSEFPFGMIPNITFLPSSSPNSKSVIQLLSILVSDASIRMSSTLWGFLSLPSPVITHRLRSSKVLQGRTASSGFISQLSSLSNELSSKSKSMGALKQSLIKVSGKSIKDIASPLSTLFGKKKKSFGDGAQIPIDNSALTANLKRASDEEARSLAMLQSAELQFKSNLENTNTLTEYILSSASVGWEMFSVSFSLRKLLKIALCKGGYNTSLDLIWSSALKAKPALPLNDSNGNSNSSVLVFDVAGGSVLSFNEKNNTQPNRVAIKSSFGVPLNGKTFQRLHTIVNPAPTHRIRSNPSRDSEIKCELDSGGVILIDSIFNLSNGETWGYCPEHSGWTLVKEDGGLEYLTATQTIPDSPIEDSLKNPSLFKVMSGTGKVREVAAVEQRGEFLKFHFLGFSPSHNEWIHKESNRIVSKLSEDFDEFSTTSISYFDDVGRHLIQHQPHCGLTPSKFVEMQSNALHSTCERLHSLSKEHFDKIESIHSTAEENGWMRGTSTTTDPVEVAVKLNEETEKGVLECWEQHESTRHSVREYLADVCCDFVQSQYKAKCREVEMLENSLTQLNDLIDQNDDENTTDDLLSLTTSCYDSLPPLPPVTPTHVVFNLSNVINVITPQSIQESWSDFLSPRNARTGEIVSIDESDFEIGLFGDLIKPIPRSPLSGKKSDSSLEYRPGTPQQPSVTDSEPNDSPSNNNQNSLRDQLPNKEVSGEPLAPKTVSKQQLDIKSINADESSEGKEAAATKQVSEQQSDTPSVAALVDNMSNTKKEISKSKEPKQKTKKTNQTQPITETTSKAADSQPPVKSEQSKSSDASVENSSKTSSSTKTNSKSASEGKTSESKVKKTSKSDQNTKFTPRTPTTEKAAPKPANPSKKEEVKTKKEMKDVPPEKPSEVPMLSKIPSKKKVIKRKLVTPREDLTPRTDVNNNNTNNPNELFNKHLSARMQPLQFDDSLIQKSSPPQVSSSRKQTAGSRLASAWDDL